MDENERQLRKLNLIVANYQQKLANADLTIADNQAEFQLLQMELSEKNQKIAELEQAAEAKASNTRAKAA